METLEELRGSGLGFGLGDDVKGEGGGVDDGCSGDADVGVDVTDVDVLVGDPGLVGSEKGDSPEVALRGVVAVGVEGVDAVLLGGDEEDVVDGVVGEGEGGEVERLRVDVADDGKAEELAEGGDADVGGSEEGLLALDPNSRVGVLLRRDTLAEGREGQKKQQQENKAEREEWGSKRAVRCCALRPGT